MREWADRYGSVFSLKVGPSSIIVLCDREAIHKLLVEKGSVYSDRPPSYVGRLLTRGDHLALEQMDSTWRDKRKVISHNFSPKRLDEQHFRVQEADPDGFYNHIRRYTASVVTSITYGFRAASFESFWGHGVYDVMTKWTASMEPGANPPVDVFTFLRHVPASFAYWKRRAIDAGKTMDETWSTARRLVEERRAHGEKRNCIIDGLLDEYEQKGWPASISQHAFTNLMGEIIEGGADTTAAQLLTLILAFALHPEIQRKAQAEIDEVCGNDEYNGMFIPKDSTVFIATWALHHTDANYPSHDTFNPDRYLKHPKLANDYAGSPEWSNRDHYNYGAGRRICPGIHLAERNMWRIAAKLLWAFDFAEPLDPETGKVMPLDANAYNPGILQAPLEFKARITPRSEAHVATIRREHTEAEGFLAQYA
ncbi:Cytochrome P450 monooxygenase yanC [Colletotrichum sp. SAR 10_70]|nr:Cytochrome P450 monooxygenase yanC [Colletotrichum sp. SAR 10_71]KAI8181276.1 Cytochrome P450 monooxygenase yanC [Colletotrichum sp. SAR 10_70]KAI8195619.1 Cytochrome P450 monooxygenase yanC [Colletotrichum sp. SAR 10_65]KAI8252092.1 Cytochrome P450 monooxygenase yanC [Colletotrichum sp. SAR 10_77]KAJ5000027.1 Cytochrome P450 monooxygenase yanC [Colletotrichum sp. SAR 10_66]